MFCGYLAHHRVTFEDPSLNSLEMACRDGACASKIADLLASPDVNPADHNSLCLVAAVRFGHVDTVRLLLQDGRVNPKSCDALYWACTRDAKAEMIQLLVAALRIEPAIGPCNALDRLFESDTNLSAVQTLLEARFFCSRQVLNGLEDACCGNHDAIRDAVVGRPECSDLVADLAQKYPQLRGGR